MNFVVGCVLGGVVAFLVLKSKKKLLCSKDCECCLGGACCSCCGCKSVS